MADEDRSDRMTEFYHELAVNRRKPEGPPPCGHCHFCNEPLRHGERFCDSDCRDDWEKHNARG